MAVNKMYTILKNSYQGEHELFLGDMMFGQATTKEDVEDILKKIILAPDVKRAFITSKDNDTNLFYIEYNQNYEAEFYHGFAIQIFDFTTGKQYKLTEINAREEWNQMNEFLKRIIKK